MKKLLRLCCALLILAVFMPFIILGDSEPPPTIFTYEEALVLIWEDSPIIQDLEDKIEDLQDHRSDLRDIYKLNGYLLESG